MSTEGFLRPAWRRVIPSGPWFAALLILGFGIPRFVLVLRANVSGDYRWISVIFVAMALAPYVFLTREGRRRVGMWKPDRWRWIVGGFVVGFAFCAMMFVVARTAFGLDTANWFAYVARSYTDVPAELSAPDRRVYFLVFALIGMTFSPLGEELLYRGVVHESVSLGHGERTASVVDALAFSITHLAHFGIVYVGGAWRFLPVPAFLWVALLFLLCLIFSFTRRRAGSILAPIAAHAGYNLGMNYFIFYRLL